jgi:hypothetical protein
VVEGDLYRRGANDILMRCITQEEGRELLVEIHGGECGSHSSSRTLVGKAFDTASIGQPLSRMQLSW